MWRQLFIRKRRRHGEFKKGLNWMPKPLALVFCICTLPIHMLIGIWTGVVEQAGDWVYEVKTVWRDY